jgi:signal transduction histidine kinase
MSHELRTPLHAIIGFSELIKEQAPKAPTAPPIADYAGDILASGRHLLELINSILDLSKVESGTTQLTESVVPVTDVLHASLTAIRGQARGRQVALEVSVPDELPFVRVDLTKMRQVMINLLSNAVKFTPEQGKVTLSCRIPNDNAGGLVLTVADTGIGMSDADIAVALEPFGQVDSTLSRAVEGTGLGLPLARRLIELHGGRLVLRSVKGEGTTAEVWLPAQRLVRAPAEAPI